MYEARHNDASSDVQQLGRYRLIGRLSQGGMGTIHLAVAAGLGEFQKLCAVKELRRDLAQDAEFVGMFLQEAKLAARLNHANVVTTLEAGQAEDRLYLAMEFLEGRPFSEMMNRESGVPNVTLQLQLQVICDVLAGLHYAHELRDYDGRPLNIVHRDVSPQNVFVTYDGRIKVLDFGIAKAADAGHTGGSVRFKGRLGYAAPEQLQGHPVDRRTDIFAVGVMLWEAIAQRRLSARDQVTAECVRRRLKGKEPRVAEVVAGVDPVLSRICDKALCKEPAGRYATADEFRLALSCYVVKLGPWLTPAVIGRFMEARFSAERAAIQRLIRERVRVDEEPESATRPVRASAGEVQEHAAGQRSTATLVEADRTSPSRVGDRWRRNAGWVAVAGALAAGGFLTARWTMPEPSSASTVYSNVVAQSNEQGSAHDRGCIEEPGAAEPVVPGSRTKPTAAPLAGPTDAESAPFASSFRSRCGGEIVVGASGVCKVSGTGVDPALRQGAGEVPAVGLPGRPPSARHQHGEAASARGVAGEVGSVASSVSPQIGEDLRSASRLPPRALDTRNPYRP